MTRSFILTRENRNPQNCYLQLCFLSLHQGKTFISPQNSGTHSPNKSDKCKIPPLSGCVICLGSHPTANQTESFILSNFSRPVSLLVTHLAWPLLPDSTPAAQPSSEINRPLKSGGHHQKSKF